MQLLHEGVPETRAVNNIDGLRRVFFFRKMKVFDKTKCFFPIFAT